MSYTINPKAKNRWARNAENTMDLSLETDASSVYLDNGRTLEQEIGEGSMVSNVATVDSAMSKVIDGTLDGAYESCVFRGQTLVNICKNSGKDLIYTNINSSTSLCYKIKDNTWYYLIINVKQNTLNKPFRFSGWTLAHGATPMSGSEIGTSDKDVFDVGETGVKRFKIGYSNIPEDKGKTLITFVADSSTVTGQATYDIMLLEYQDGMENWDIPYFEGLCDVKMPILHNVGKNLFNINQPYDHAFTPPQKYFIENNKLHFIDAKKHENLCWLIKVNKGERIYCSCLGENNKGKMDVRFFSEKRVSSIFTNRNSWDCDGTIKSTICSDEWMLLMLNTGTDSGDFVFTNIIVSYYDTTYEDHKSNILRTSEEIVLREVNGVQDTYNPLTGEYVRRIGEAIFNGSEAWWETSIAGQTTKRFRVNFISKRNNSNQTLICDRVLSVPNSEWNVDREQIEADGKILSIRKTFNTVEDFKTWLSQNPLTVQYILAESITTIIEPLTTPFAYQNGHVILESGYEGQSLLPTLEYSTVVNRTGQIESVAKTIQAQEKQLTILEKMLIQNIINLDYNNTLLTLKNEMEEML